MDVSNLLVEVFMKVTNALVMTLEKTRFLCVWLFCCRFANGGAKISIMRSFFFFVSACSASVTVSGKIASIRSKLPTAACWSREENGEETVKPTCCSLLYRSCRKRLRYHRATDQSFTRIHSILRPLRR